MRRIVGVVAAAVGLAALGQPVLAQPAAQSAPRVAVAKAASMRTYAYGPDTQQQYDVYRSTASGRRPTVVLIHGGGWVMGDKRDAGQLSTINRFLTAGYTAVGVNYRLLDAGVTLDQAVSDVDAALDHVRAHAGSLGVDTSRIAVLGGSAGGHLAMMLGTLGRGGERVRAVVASAGMPALRLQNEVPGLGRGKASALVARSSPQGGMAAEEWYAKVDPYANAGAGDAPLLWLGATEDTYVHPELPWRMAERLRSAGVTTRVIVADDAAHGLFSSRYEHRRRALDETVRWVDSRLRGRPLVGSRTTMSLAVRRSGGSAVVEAAAETTDMPDSAPFGAPYRLYLSRKAGKKLGPFIRAGSGRLSVTATGKPGHARIWTKLPGVSAGDRVKLVVSGNGAAAVLTRTVA